VNISQLVSAIVAYALNQHQDSAWDIVATGMRRDEIAAVLIGAGAHTVNQAKRAMRAYLSDVVTNPRLATDRELVLV
jgi:hypothetical protein